MTKSRTSSKSPAGLVPDCVGQEEYGFAKILSPEFLESTPSLEDDCRLAFTSKNVEERGYSTGSTFFIKACEKPRFLLEYLAQEVFKLHTMRLGRSFDPAYSGAEWWTQVIDSRDDIGWHWDRDYGMEDDGVLVYPDVATVTYLSRNGGCTVVVPIKGDEGEMAHARNINIESSFASRVVLSRPELGKHLYFDGRYLHGAPADFDGDIEVNDEEEEEEEEDDDEEESNVPIRITFLVNIWLDHTPVQSTAFPASLSKQMKVKAPSKFQVFWEPLTATSMCEIGQQDDESAAIQWSKWAFSDCSRKYSVQLPLKACEAVHAFIAAEQQQGGSMVVQMNPLRPHVMGKLVDMGPLDQEEEQEEEQEERPRKKPRSDPIHLPGGLQIDVATTESILEIAEIINRAYDVEKGTTGVSFKKDNIDRVTDPESLREDIEAGRAVVLKGGEHGKDKDKLLGVCFYEYRVDAVKGKGCFFGPFAAASKGKGHGKLMLAEVERLAKKEGCKEMRLVVVNHRTELVQLYKKWGFELTGKISPYPEPQRLSRPSHFVHMAKLIE